MATSKKLTQIATSIVLEKATKDKLAVLKQQQRADQQQKTSCGEPSGPHAEEVADEGFDDLSHWREQRMQQLKLARQRLTALKESGHGEYSEIVESEFLGIVTKAPKAVCHFYSPRFERCRIMDKHLEIIAKAHVKTRIFKMNAEKAPFFSSKLMIRSLPSLVFFIDGVAVHTVVGFAELGSRDDFKTSTLLKLMLKHRVCDNVLKQISSDSEDSEDADK